MNDDGELPTLRAVAEEAHLKLSRSAPLKGGRINDLWKVETNEGTLCLRRSPAGRRKKQVAFELSLMTHLAEGGSSVPAPRCLHGGEPVIEFDERLYCFFPWIDVAENAALPTPRELADVLRPLFAGLRTFEPPFSPVRQTRVIERPVLALLDALDGQQRTSIERVWDEVREWEKKADLPTGAIHADLYPDNILRALSGALFVIDFDDAHVSTRALDWILAALEFSFEGATLIEERYEEYLEAIVPPDVTEAERSAEPWLRRLLLLKFAASEHALGTPRGDNRYLGLL